MTLRWCNFWKIQPILETGSIWNKPFIAFYFSSVLSYSVQFVNILMVELLISVTVLYKTFWPLCQPLKYLRPRTKVNRKNLLKEIFFDKKLAVYDKLCHISQQYRRTTLFQLNPLQWFLIFLPNFLCFECVFSFFFISPSHVLLLLFFYQPFFSFFGVKIILKPHATCLWILLLPLDCVLCVFWERFFLFLIRFCRIKLCYTIIRKHHISIKNYKCAN